MAFSIKFRADAVRTLAFGGIGASYAPVGTIFTHPVRAILFQNLTDATLMFSFDGIIDHFPLLAYSYIILDVCSDKVTENGWFISVNTTIYVKRIGTPGSGSVYVSAFYGQGD